MQEQLTPPIVRGEAMRRSLPLLPLRTTLAKFHYYRYPLIKQRCSRYCTLPLRVIASYSPSEQCCSFSTHPCAGCLTRNRENNASARPLRAFVGSGLRDVTQNDRFSAEVGFQGRLGSAVASPAPPGGLRHHRRHWLDVRDGFAD